MIFAVQFNVYAQHIMDIYGANSSKSTAIIQKYFKKITEIERNVLDLSKLSEDEYNVLKKNKKQLIHLLMQEGNFLYVDFNTVFYQDTPNIYTTVEVIEQKDIDRLNFVTSLSSVDKYSSKTTPDLIDSMTDYLNLGMDLYFNKLTVEDDKCPVYHCTIGFDHPKLKPYLMTFNRGAVTQKQLILDTLRHDQSSERRAAAAFLVGHFQNPHEIIKILLPCLYDQNPQVRNNIIRVIGTTMKTAKIYQIDALPFVKLLNSPYETDRNKSLYILIEIANLPVEKEKIIKNGRFILLKLLALKQPNNHDEAYKLLKIISNKSYADTDIIAWQNWALSMK